MLKVARPVGSLSRVCFRSNFKETAVPKFVVVEVQNWSEKFRKNTFNDTLGRRLPFVNRCSRE